MNPIESVRLAIADLDANTHHGVVPSSLARDLIYQVAQDCLDVSREAMAKLISEFSGK
jgi:hypothetical protein